MKIKFIGAAGGSVTGSCTLFHYPRTKTSFLVDCGLVQGEGDFESINSAPFPFDASSIQFVLLTHAHLDHCGLLPKLYRAGFSGEVLCTSATAELAHLSLLDSAGHLGNLFTRDEVNRVRFKAVDDPDAPKKAIFPIRKDLFASFRLTAHIAGSASVTIGWIDDNGQHRYVVMSGDLGNNTKDNLFQPLLSHRRGIYGYPDAIVIESTYGNRFRPPEQKSFEARMEALRGLLQRELFERKAILVIPAFALQRTQEVLFDLVVVLQRYFSTEATSTAPYLAGGRFYDECSNGCWTRLAHAAIERALQNLPEDARCRWADAFEDSEDSTHPVRLKAGHPGTAEELQSMVEAGQCPFPIDVIIDAKLARSMGDVIRKELTRRNAHKPGEWASRNPELQARLGLQDEQSMNALLEQLLPTPGIEVPPLHIGPHTLRHVDAWKLPSTGPAQLRGTILITGGGMCDGGPVVAHLQKLATQKRECLLVQTGYMAKYSLGKRLFDLAHANDPGQTRPSGTITIGTAVDIPNEEIRLRAVDMSGYYSGHADQEGLLDFLFTTDGRASGDTPPLPATVFINHGNAACRQGLQEAISKRQALQIQGERAIRAVELPTPGQQAYDLNLGQWVDDSEVLSAEETMAALLREQIKTNELLRQVLAALSRPAARGPYVKSPPVKTRTS
jgi:metallo-beta-lactamase family protein